MRDLSAGRIAHDKGRAIFPPERWTEGLPTQPSDRKSYE
ncbi:hypothetical protein GGR01_001336 [Acetobacter oeni]|nr:hypothetical protein [Acetobacter oeni]